MRLALQMSIEGNNSHTETLSSSSGGSDEVDNEFMKQLLQSVDVDINDPAIQAALHSSSDSTSADEKEPKNKKSKQ